MIQVMSYRNQQVNQHQHNRRVQHYGTNGSTAISIQPALSFTSFRAPRGNTSQTSFVEWLVVILLVGFVLTVLSGFLHVLISE
jgi:hypothetical protein